MNPIEKTYSILLKTYGPQGWWPIVNRSTSACEYGIAAPRNERDMLEIAVGAILTQSVAWKNAEKALASLINEKILSMNELITISPSGLAPLIKPAGYFNEKAKKIKNFMKWLEDKGGNFNAFGDMDTSALRNELLAINGVGPETADSILLYALSRKVFVVDAYTKRIFFRLGVFTGKEKYDEIQRRFHHEFRGEINEYNEYHALIVAHGKDICKKKPVCGMCCLSGMCHMLV